MTDRVFGPNTNTDEVYEVAARPVVKAAMEGINGMVNLLLLPNFVICGINCFSYSQVYVESWASVECNCCLFDDNKTSSW